MYLYPVVVFRSMCMYEREREEVYLSPVDGMQVEYNYLVFCFGLFFLL